MLAMPFVVERTPMLTVFDLDLQPLNLVFFGAQAANCVPELLTHILEFFVLRGGGGARGATS